jgi:hypothetical protein
VKAVVYKGSELRDLEAYRKFDRREDGWTKVLLHPAA